MNLSFIENVTDNVFNKANASVNLKGEAYAFYLIIGINS
ncbi:hypothetical protein C8E03_11217 [Lachnotalea glycerini]|uniref:Uncharacterized protein n=1 Tax=Lachnotalea glycerini TaxID=1763509 RepID=A0A318EJV4_9FIRM|nr:hypothetical protein C8E03_11217 [Lachnotalea glycerini]